MRADTFTSGPDQGGRSRGNRSAPPPSSRLQPADLADTRCPDCGHPRTCDVCSCTGPGTCGGGTDDVEGGA